MVWLSPRLIRHDQGKESTLHLSSSDQEASLLLLEDLGRLISIVDFIKYNCNGQRIVSEAKLQELSSTICRAISTIHISKTASIIQSLAKSAQCLTHSYTESVELQTGVERIKERLGSRYNAESLYKRVLK